MKALRIFDHGDGTVRIKREPSFNTLAPMAANELARFDMDNDALPAAPDGVDSRFWAWDGSALVEASQAVQDAIAATDAEAQAAQAAALLARQESKIGGLTVYTENNELHISGRLVAERVDVETSDPTAGIIQRDNNNHRWLRIVDTDGKAVNVKISSSPEVSHAERVARITAAKDARAIAKQTVRDKGAKFAVDAEAARNVPDIRAALVVLQEQMAALQELLGVE